MFLYIPFIPYGSHICYLKALVATTSSNDHAEKRHTPESVTLRSEAQSIAEKSVKDQEAQVATAVDPFDDEDRYVTGIKLFLIFV